jgi:type IV secretory pathway TraG/TraD family ATPase VirD4
MVAAPLTAVAAAGAAMLGSHGPLQVAVAAGMSAVLGYTGGKVIARGGAPDRLHQRGSVVAEQMPPAKARAPKLSHSAAITLAGLEVPAQDETKHFKLIGTTGTGKSTAIQEIMQSALARGDRAIIADPDGGYLRRFYRQDRGDIILNPFDNRSVKWDLFAEIRANHDVEQLARSLIPDHDGQDRSWRGYARTFFAAVTRQARAGGVSDVGELYRLLVVADAGELRGLLHGTPAQPFLDEHNSRMFDSIRSVTSSAVGSLDYVSQQKSAGFSVRDWVSEEKPGVLFIPYKAGEIAALRSTISGWMRLAIFETMDRGEQKAGLWFVVDELDALGQIDGLKDALARLRKFNGRCVLGFQSIAQVSSTYGQGDAHTIVENCGNTLILRCSASEGGGTARFASQLIGEREVLRTTLSKSRRATDMWESVSRNQHFAVEPAVLASQVEQLPDLSGYLKYASDPSWQRVRLDAKNAWNELKSTSIEPRGDPPRRAMDLSHE